MPKHQPSPDRKPKPRAKLAARKQAKGSGKVPAADQKPVLVVGIGASAGGIKAFQSFFRSMPDGHGLAFVLIAHLNPRQHSILAEVVGQSTRMPVRQVTAKVRLEPNHVYVIAPGTLLTVADGVLVPERADEVRAPIDVFFLSVAAAYDGRAVCVVLSGTGSDGTMALKAVKENGGLVIAQETDSAQFSGMPRSAAKTGLVDAVLPVEEMPAKLIEHARRVVRFSDGHVANGLEKELRERLVNICTLLRTKTGHDFSQYKENTLLRRILRRMQVLQLDQADGYLDRLRKDPSEIELLFQDLLIGVTHFFRDRDAYKALAAKVVPRLFDSCVDGQIRIWVPGCATGEEAYSIAILLREQMQRVDVMPRIQIFATDIDESALAIARAGIYPDAIARDVTPQRLKQFFAARGNLYQVNKDVREMCVFSAHNMIKDPPFSRLDLISCRNLLIYMNADLQNRVFPLFHFALRPGRFLFLGPSENVSHQTKYFVAVDGRHRIFRATAAVAPQLPLLPLPGGERAVSARQMPAMPRADGQKALIAAVERQLLSHHVPAYVVVNENYELIYSSAATGRYLELPAGAPSANVLDMARRELRFDLRAALARMKQGARRAVQSEATVSLNGGTQALRLTVQPLKVAEDGGKFYLITFQDIGPVRPDLQPKRAKAHTASESQVVKQLEAELRATQERLQTTIEELETSNEELKSSNEEFQSMNEELQSANEELETSREELQSVNEELETVNGELSSKVELMNRSNSDLKNLLENTQIATVFLDRQRRIKNFTPAAKDIFRLIDSDIDRPITDIVARLDYDGLMADIDRVLRTLTPVEREVPLDDGRSAFIMRILPYRALDNSIDGVVLTFLDITERRAVEEERARLGTIVAFSHDAIIGITLEGDISAWNAGAERMLGYSSKEAVGRRWTVLFPPYQMKEEEQAFAAAKRDEAVLQQDSVMATKERQTAPVSLSMSAAKDLSGRIIGVSLIARDITERKRADENQRLLLAELNHRVKNMMATVLSIANQTIEECGSLAAFGDAFTGRIRALAETHTLLSKGNWAGVRLHDIAAAEAAPYRARGGENFTMSGPEIVITPRAALSLSLVLHELTTNAVKYGALSTSKGVVGLTWQIVAANAARLLVIEWTECGGPKVKPAIRSGLGRRLIEQSLSYELGGEAKLGFRAEGANCRMEIPVTEATVVERASNMPAFPSRGGRDVG